ncbi:MAG TPA: type II secretion system protein [Bacillota bacterium]
MRWLKNQLGFTFVETLVVLAIVSFTAGLTIPRAVQETRDKRALADLRTMTVALSIFNQRYGTYPLYLQELTDADLIMSDFDYRNASGRYYFYAVHFDIDGDRPERLDHYVLGDPGGNPEVRYDTKDWTAVTRALTPNSPGLPEGRDPGGYTAAAGYRPRTYIYGRCAGRPGPMKITTTLGDLTYDGVDVVWLQETQPGHDNLRPD